MLRRQHPPSVAAERTAAGALSRKSLTSTVCAQESILISSMSKTSMPCGLPGVPSYASRAGIQNRRFSPSTIIWTPFGPSVDHAVQAERRRLAACHGAVESCGRSSSIRCSGRSRWNWAAGDGSLSPASGLCWPGSIDVRTASAGAAATSGGAGICPMSAGGAPEQDASVTNAVSRRRRLSMRKVYREVMRALAPRCSSWPRPPSRPISSRRRIRTPRPIRRRPRGRRSSATRRS